MFELDENRFSGTKLDINFGFYEGKPLKIDLNFILNMVLVGSKESSLSRFLESLDVQFQESGLEMESDIISINNTPFLEFFDRLAEENKNRMQQSKNYSNSSPATRFLPLNHKIIIYKNFDEFLLQGMEIKTIELGIIGKIITFTRMTLLHQLFCIEDIDNLNTTVLSSVAPYTFDFFVIFDNENLQKFISSKRFYKSSKDLNIMGPDEAVIVSQGQLLKINLKIGS